MQGRTVGCTDSPKAERFHDCYRGRGSASQLSQIDRTARWGLEATHAVHLRLIGKPIVVFLFAITEHFSLGIMVEAIRVNIDLRLSLLKGVSHFITLCQNFR